MISLQAWTAGGAHAEIGGHQIFYRVDGPKDGPPVTLIHGFPTSSHDWNLILPSLIDSGHRVITFDMLGFGASDKPHGHNYRIVEQAGILNALWLQLDVAGTALVAHDYGVTVAQELLSRDQSRYSSVTWLNGGLYPDLHRPIPIQKLLHGPLGALIAPLGSERTFRKAMGQILGRPVSDETLHEMWLSYSSGGGKGVQHRLLRYIDERREFATKWVGALEGYSGRSQFIWGPADPISGAHVLERLRERIPRADYVVLDQTPATGHYPALENPDAVAQALVRFLGAGIA